MSAVETRSNWKGTNQAPDNAEGLDIPDFLRRTVS